MSKGTPFIDYNKYAPGVQDEIDQIDYNAAPKLNDKSLKDCTKELLNSLNSSDLNKLEQPTKEFSSIPQINS